MRRQRKPNWYTLDEVRRFEAHLYLRALESAVPNVKFRLQTAHRGKKDRPFTEPDGHIHPCNDRIAVMYYFRPDFTERDWYLIMRAELTVKRTMEIEELEAQFMASKLEPRHPDLAEEAAGYHDQKACRNCKHYRDIEGYGHFCEQDKTTYPERPVDAEWTEVDKFHEEVCEWRHNHSVEPSGICNLHEPPESKAGSPGYTPPETRNAAMKPTYEFKVSMYKGIREMYLEVSRQAGPDDSQDEDTVKTEQIEVESVRFERFGVVMMFTNVSQKSHAVYELKKLNAWFSDINDTTIILAPAN